MEGKKSVTVFLVALLVLSLAGPAYCAGSLDKPFEKFGRGICNVFTAPMEIPNRIGKTYASSGRREAYTYGVIQGIAMMGFRMAVGLIELVTFPIPFPSKYEPILNDPEYFFYP